MTSTKGLGGLIGLGVGLLLAREMIKPMKKFMKPLKIPKIKKFKY